MPQIYGHRRCTKQFAEGVLDHGAIKAPWLDQRGPRVQLLALYRTIVNVM